MSADNIDANSSLKAMDIWLDSGNIDGFKVTARLGAVLRSGEFEKFQVIIGLLESERFIGKISQRIKVLKNQYNGVHHVLNEVKGNNKYQQIILKPFGDEKTEVDDFDGIEHRPSGLYFRNQKSGSYNYFESDFGEYYDDLKVVLKERGFDKKQATYNQEKIRILDFANFHEYNHNFYAISDQNGYYDIHNAARLAKLSYVNFKSNGDKKLIDEAIILPFDHACNNYYHNVSELFSGLRFISQLPENIPIIYTEDRFGIMDFIISRLFIKRDRLISIKECKDIVVKKAIQLYPFTYYWDHDVYSFFKQISYPQTKFSKIYISRRKSARGPVNEIEIEQKLQELGFTIMFPEELSFQEQVFAFSNVSLLVAPHGAGLANIAFMPHGASLIEIFDSGYVLPDFYFRSRPNGIKYNCMIFKDQLLDFSELQVLLNRCSE